jgi:hypothetical protein
MVSLGAVCGGRGEGSGLSGGLLASVRSDFHNLICCLYLVQGLLRRGPETLGKLEEGIYKYFHLLQCTRFMQYTLPVIQHLCRIYAL